MLSYLILYLKKCALLLQLGALALCTLIRDLMYAHAFTCIVSIQ